MHGIGVHMAEALAEFWHKRIRQELNIATNDGPLRARPLRLPLPGCRCSFGYPAYR